MSLRDKLIELLGGVAVDEARPLTGDPCLDEGHDFIELRAATASAPLGRRCKRCGLWMPADPPPAA